MIRNILVPLNCTIMALFLSAGCGGKELQSQWKDREIVIDGQTPEWYGAVTYLKDDKVSVGLMNDDEFLYVSFTAGDRETQIQVLVRGATLWFDPDGGNDRAFGVRFPLGILEGGMRMDRENRPELHELIAAYRGPDVEMEILHGEDDPLRMKVVDVARIDVAVDDVQGILVYELKVPLRDHPHGIGAEAGSTIGVRFETQEIDFEELRERMMAQGRGRPPGGGGRGGGGGGMGGPGGGMGGQRPDIPEPIDVSVRVILASPGSAQTPIVKPGDD